MVMIMIIGSAADVWAVVVLLLVLLLIIMMMVTATTAMAGRSPSVMVVGG